MAFAEETLVLPWRADIDFNQKEREIFEDAINEWYQWTRGKVLFQFDFDLHKNDLDAHKEKELLWKVPSNFYLIQECRKAFDIDKITGMFYDRCIYIAEDHFRSSLLGCSRLLHSFGYYGGLGHFNQQITNEVELNYRFLKNTLMHELGHYWGLQHTEWNSIMSSGNRSLEHFTELDVIEFCRVHQTKIDEFSY